MTELGASGGQKGKKKFLLVCHLHKKVHYVYQVNGNNGYWVARLAQDRFGFWNSQKFWKKYFSFYQQEVLHSDKFWDMSFLLNKQF